MKLRSAIGLALLCTSIYLPVPAPAATILVPADQATIQGGIEAAVDGDLVLVAPGTYLENIDLLGKAITLSSEAGADLTVIDGGACSTGEDSCSVVTMIDGETRSAILDGFTIKNGRGSDYCPTGGACPHKGGGGISCYQTSAMIINCSILGNTTPDLGLGGGILCLGEPSPSIMNCTISVCPRAEQI